MEGNATSAVKVDGDSADEDGMLERRQRIYADAGVSGSTEVPDLEPSANAAKTSPNGREPIGGQGPAGGQTKPHGAFRALRHRNFRIFWCGQLVSLIGTWMQNLAQGWLIVMLVDPVGRALLRHGGSAVGGVQSQHSGAVEAAANVYSGWVSFVGGIPILLFTLLAGVLADRVDKRRLLLATQTCLLFTSFGLGVLCYSGSIQIWHVLLFAGLSGIAVAFDMPARQSFVVEMVGRNDLPSAVALNSSVFNAARALGPALAGLILAAHISIGAAFLGNTVLTIAPLCALLVIRVDSQARITARPRADQPDEDEEPSTLAVDTADGPVEAVEAADAVEDPNERRRLAVFARVWSNMREGFSYVRSNPTVANLVLLVGSFGTFAFSFNILVPVFVRYVLLPHSNDAAQVKAFGFMETVRGLGALAAALSVAVLGNARRQRNMLVIGALMSTVLLIAFALARSLFIADLMMMLVSYGFVLCFATSNTLVQLTVPDHLRGRVMSIYTLVFIGTMPIGSLFAGWVARFFGTSNTILLCAMISLLTALIIVFRPGGLLTVGRVESSKARV